ncbi:MAG: twin-arginine translocase TatA/TatE family subunit [Polyangiaceae bacterium]|nr:twin-arginine translocase TatA/TatE family subunit [Polyangiaceae bacterium]MCW5792593.1 twin-arginine translocase TatA/TatE family subunit [Polyangiaceae bacterium]
MAISPLQILLVALIILILFGASRLGDIGKGLGEGIRNFKKGISGDDDEEPSSKKAKKEPKQLTEGSKVSSSKRKQEEEEES